MLRRPDGTPETRGLDEMLRDAVSREDLAGLPGKGKRLDLRDYFDAGEEHRVANKVLKDNQVLPRHLADRKEVEALREAAAEGFRADLEAIHDLRTALDADLVSLAAFFASRNDFLASTGITGWHGDAVHEGLWPSRRRTRARAESAVGSHAALRRRAMEAERRCRDRLESANRAAERAYRDTVRNGRIVPAYPPPARRDVETDFQALAGGLPTAPELPADLVERVVDIRAARVGGALRRLADVLRIRPEPGSRTKIDKNSHDCP